MYDRRLDAILAAAELGSFSRAASRLSVSTPALLKQVSGFEAEHGLRLFDRSYAGVTPTPAGESLIADARAVIRISEEALRRARDAAHAESTVRMGVSIMSPGRQTLEVWPIVRDENPDLHLELVPIGSLYDEAESVMPRLGREVDVVQTSFSSTRWAGMCDLMPVRSVRIYLDVPRTSALAARSSVGIGDLVGMRVRVLRHANDETDRVRATLLEHGGIDVVDEEIFDVALLDDAMDRGDAVITSGAWSGIHPGLIGVPFEWDSRVPCYLAYPLDPTPQVERFVRGVGRAIAADIARCAR